MARLFFSLLAMSLISSCSNWVQVTSEGQAVNLIATDVPDNCNRVGRVQARTLGRIIGIERGAERLQDELAQIARNEAADRGGNTIAPESLIIDGRQTFGIYSCP